MKRRELLGALMGFAAAPFFAQSAFAGPELDAAIAETQKAINYGEEAHHASSFSQHIDNAIDHAMMAQRAHPDPHIKKALGYLRRGRRIAYRTHWPNILRSGARQAKKGLAELQAAQSAAH